MESSGRRRHTEPRTAPRALEPTQLEPIRGSSLATSRHAGTDNLKKLMFRCRESGLQVLWSNKRSVLLDRDVAWLAGVDDLRWAPGRSPNQQGDTLTNFRGHWLLWICRADGLVSNLECSYRYEEIIVVLLPLAVLDEYFRPYLEQLSGKLAREAIGLVRDDPDQGELRGSQGIGKAARFGGG